MSIFLSAALDLSEIFKQIVWKNQKDTKENSLAKMQHLKALKVQIWLPLYSMTYIDIQGVPITTVFFQRRTAPTKIIRF